MYLLELESGNVSIEYQPEDHAIIKQRMDRIGPSFRTSGFEMDMVHFRGARLINMRQWDAPCLISVDRRGRGVLLELFAALQEQVVSEPVMV